MEEEVMKVEYDEGIEVKDDIKVVGFEDSEIENMVQKKIKNVRKKILEMKRDEEDMILRKMERGEKQNEKRIEYKIIVRKY